MADPETNERLRALERDLGEVKVSVAVITSRLDSFPTKESLWKGLALAAGSVIATIIGAVAWAGQQYLAPLLEALHKLPPG